MSYKPVPQSSTRSLASAQERELVFNFRLALPGRASSRHTQRAYFRWVDAFLCDLAELKPTQGMDRMRRMEMLPVELLEALLSAGQLRAWLGQLTMRGQGKQAIDQARAAIVTLAALLAEAGWIDERDAAAMARVRPPQAEDGQRPGRWLSLEELRQLMNAAPQIATSDEQAVRNEVVIGILCTMALRREELSSARWGDLSLQDSRVVMRIHGKGRKVAYVDVPRFVVNQLSRWRKVVTPDALHPQPRTPLVRRIWKGGRVADTGLSPDGIWLIVDLAAREAGLGHVAPHDLRRSVAGALHQSGVPIETISRLLRHSNVDITERYLNRMPRPNEGAILMSQTLGFEGDDAMWPGFDGPLIQPSSDKGEK